MNRSFWHLPSTNRFLDNILNDVHLGKNVVIGLPSYNTGGLYYALSDKDIDNHKMWRRISVKSYPEASSPIELLFAYFNQAIPTNQLLQINSLFDISDFLGRRIWLEDIPGKYWATWSRFIEEYQHACGALQCFDRPLLIAKVQGQMSNHLPKSEIRLATYQFRNVMSSLDTKNYIYQVRNLPLETSLEKRVAEAVIIELALWDINLVQFLAHRPLEELLNPSGILQKYVDQTSFASQDTNYDWTKGHINQFEGKERIHICLYKDDTKQREVERRVWRAQVGVLLPFIEEQRRELIEELGSELDVPFQPEYGRLVTNRLDLEIGHLYVQIREKYDIDWRTKQRIDYLRKMRNQLAHLDCISDKQIRQYHNLLN